METIFNFKSSSSQLFDIVKKEVISLTAVTFPQHFEIIEPQLITAFKSLKQDMQCWIPMLQHNLLQEEDIYLLIVEKKQQYNFEWSNCPGIDPADVDRFAGEICHLIYSAIVTSYLSVSPDNSLLSKLYSLCIGKNGWKNTDYKNRLAIT